MKPRSRVRWGGAAVRFARVVLGCTLLAAGLRLYGGDELVLTVTASANGTASIEDVYTDRCSISFTARVVYRPDPKTGRYDVAEETYTLTAGGGGQVKMVGSFDYLARQPGPGTVSLMDLDFQEGTAYVALAPLDLLVDTSDEEFNNVAYARGACGGAQSMWAQQPEYGRMIFPPNAAGFNAGGNGSGRTSLFPAEGEFTIHYNLSRGDAPVEAVILPPKDYETWLPEGSDDETIPGPKPFTVAVELRVPGTQAPPEGRLARFRFEMQDTSREPGLCLNKPSKDEAATAYDLWFVPGAGKKVSNEMQTLETENLAAKASAGIACYDYGASSRLRVTAILDDGREIVAHVEGDTGRTTLAIPQDENDNHVADGWEKLKGVFARSLPAEWDGDDKPPDQGGDGDGISLFEDYRGFFFGRRHERLDPGYKHLFVYDRDGYVLETMKAGPKGINFPAASGCRVRFVTDRTWTGHGPFGGQKRIVNFNYKRAHKIDQHAIEVQIVTETTPLEPEDWYDIAAGWGYADPRDSIALGTGGAAYPDASSPPPYRSSPANSFVIQVYPAHLNARITGAVRWNTQGLPAFAGYLDLPADERAAKAAAFEAEVRRYLETHQDQYRDCWWKMVSRVVVHEMGHGVGIRDLKPSLSGPMECVMRYLSNDEIGIDANDRFELRRRDPWPHTFCTRADGSPVGKSCQKQIRITDER